MCVCLFGVVIIVRGGADVTQEVFTIREKVPNVSENVIWRDLSG